MALNIRVQTGNLAEADADTLIIYLFENNKDFGEATKTVNDALNGLLLSVIDAGDFTGKADEALVLYTQDQISAKRVIVVGLGEQGDFTVEALRRAAATGINKAKSLKADTVATVTAGTNKGGLDVKTSAQAIAEATQLALYNYHGQKSEDTPETYPKTLIILTDDSDQATEGVMIGTAFANGTNLTRELANLPANICTPAYMAQQAETMANKVGLTAKILERQQLQALKMGALLGVAQGSDTPPRFIILEHNADKADDLDTIVLVGKGVTFDTGGYSLKSRDGMVGMKGDMSGGAAVIGAMQIIAQLNIPLHVVGLVPAADNMVSGNAYRPQDVITASNGKTIEIISTDAEGRLLLADALVYAKRYEPNAVLDIATLTGSIAVALGGAAAGVYTNKDELADKLKQAGAEKHERTWQMPMFSEYGKSLESDTADTKNSGGAAGRWGGAGVAAHFLSHFVDFDWAHIDMAGTLFASDTPPYQPKGSASGYGARLLAEFVRQWSD